MYNIIKSMSYQIKRDNFTYYAILAAFGLYFFIICYSGPDAKWEEFTGSYMVQLLGNGGFMGLSVAILLLSTRIMGWDYTDKTINYEILAGHKRSEVYWGRVIASLICNIGLIIPGVVAPIGLCTIINGWGNGMEVGGALLRVALFILPLLRLTCEFTFITVLMSNGFVGLIVGYIYLQVSSLATVFIEEMNDKINITWQLVEANCIELLTFNSKMGFIDGEDVVVYITDIEPSLIISTVVASLGISAVLLILGYVIFKKRDLR